MLSGLHKLNEFILLKFLVANSSASVIFAVLGWGSTAIECAGRTGGPAFYGSILPLRSTSGIDENRDTLIIFNTGVEKYGVVCCSDLRCQVVTCL